MKVTSIVHVVFAVLDVISGFFGGFLVPAIFPLGAHYVVSGIVIMIKLAGTDTTNEEREAIEAWRFLAFSTFALVVLSAMPAAMLFMLLR